MTRVETAVATDHPYLTTLNDPQRQAVETIDGPVLVLSGAGTGKTRVLTTRIAHILNQRKAWPSEILAVTFTNKAAREMAHRATALLQGEGESRGNVVPWLGTFHSISAKMLRQHGEKLGFNSDFIILDTDDQIRLVKAILLEQNVDIKQHPPKQFLHQIQQWKDRGLTPEKVTHADALAAGGNRSLELYTEYQKRLLALNAMDFGDLLLHCLTLFTTRQDVLETFAQRFKYILVDEYQDTNVAQYLWLRLLALGHKNICCVGDDDQSIYGWRGAEVGNILRFEKDFPGATIVRLEQNYRSTPQILAAASHLIAKNSTRLGKTLWTASDDGENLKLQSTVDSEEEAYLVGEQIEYLHRQKEPYREMAVLVRAGFQTRQFEERFLTLGLPYQVIGGLRFYERQEIKDAIAYLRVTQHAADNLAFERIINTPKRGIGNATLERMHSTGRKHGLSLYDATAALIATGKDGAVEERIRGKVADTLRDLLNHFDRWRTLRDSMNIAELTDIVLDESGYRGMWEKEKSADANGRLENLRELTRAMGEFESLTAFLEHVGLVTDIAENNRGANGDMVTLMTLHAAKGLEFNSVFLPGWEEGLFPHQRALDESGKDGLEEERRLAYVGITRARKRVFLTHAERRRFFTKSGVEWQPTVPSRFLTELPMEHVDTQDAHTYARFADRRRDWASDISSILTGGANPFAARNAPAPYGASGSNGRPATQSAGKTSPSSGPSTGTRVFHQKFGYGKVVNTQDGQLEIAFEKSGTKRIMADFVEVVQ